MARALNSIFYKGKDNRMKTSLFNKLLVCGVVLGVLVASNALANDEKPGRQHAEWEKKMDGVLNTLNLTEEQHAQLKTVHEKYRGEGKELMEAMFSKREELETAIESDTLDEAKVKQLHAELKELKTKMEDKRLEGIIAVRHILTPEQFKKFNAQKKEMRKQFRESRSMGSKKGDMGMSM